MHVKTSLFCPGSLFLELFVLCLQELSIMDIQLHCPCYYLLQGLCTCSCHRLVSQNPPSTHILRHTYSILILSSALSFQGHCLSSPGHPDSIQRDCHSIMHLFFQCNTFLLFFCYRFKVNISSIEAAARFLFFIVFLASMTIVYTQCAFHSICQIKEFLKTFQRSID